MMKKIITEAINRVGKKSISLISRYLCTVTSLLIANKHFALEVTQIERLRGDLATQWRNQYGCDHPREG